MFTSATFVRSLEKSSSKPSGDQVTALKIKRKKMFKAIRSRWAAKILVAFLLIIVLTGVINTAVMNLSIQSAFDRHLGRMGEGMQTMMGGTRGVNLYGSFRAAVNESLLTSFAVASLIAVAASLLISRLITHPVNTL